MGLRWWSQINEDGSEEWIFESLPGAKANAVDSTMFWGACYITPIVWIVLMVTGLLSLELATFSMSLINVGLAAVNLLGYIKC